MTDDVRATLREYVIEVIDLRFAGELPTAESTPQQMLEALQGVRGRLDRIEAIHSKALRLRGRAQRSRELATGIVNDAWDRAAQQGRAAPVVRGDEFSSARERHADANLAVLDLRLAERSATELAHECEEAAKVIDLHHRGLGDLRHELLTQLRVLQFESVLER